MGYFFNMLAMTLKKPITVVVLMFHVLAAPVVAGESPAAFDKARMEELVKRSYQYAVMYHINNRIALDPSFARFTGGYNKFMTALDLFDHTAKGVARPNNDTLYLAAMLDLRKDPVLLELPAFDSGYVLMMATGYDYYVNIPMSTTKGDFKKPEKVLFHTARTEGYKGGKMEGIDRAVEMSCDFVSVILHVMPHASDKARFERVRGQMKMVKLRTLSEFQGKPAKAQGVIKFPAFGKSVSDIFATNLPEIMQFAFNHTTFDPKDSLDQGVLAVWKSVGIEPGKTYEQGKGARIDGAQLQKVAIDVAASVRQLMADKTKELEVIPKLFKPKGKTDLETMVIQAVIGPIGQPTEEVMSLEAALEPGLPFNAQRDYIIRMKKDELPPASGFWSLTLYDREGGSFIPNDRKKYAVGENSGMKVDQDGGIEIVISAEKPLDVPDENWLPINRGDIALVAQLRIYAPNLDAMKNWKAPRVELLP